MKRVGIQRTAAPQNETDIYRQVGKSLELALILQPVPALQTMTAEREQVEHLLRDHGINPTKQRMEVGMVLLTRPCHMSADQILNTLRDNGNRISKATVYNTLNLFSNCGVVRQVAVDPTHMMYDSTVHPHHHFYDVDYR